MGDSDEELELVLLLALSEEAQTIRRRKRRMWVRPIFTQRRQQGAYHRLLQEMRLSDPESNLHMYTHKYICMILQKQWYKYLQVARLVATYFERASYLVATVVSCHCLLG